MSEQGSGTGPWEGIVHGLTQTGEFSAAMEPAQVDQRIRLQLIPGSDPFETVADLLDTYEINIAKGMLAPDEQSVAGDFLGAALAADDPRAFVAEQVVYEEGSNGLIAVLNFPGARHE